MRQIIIFAASLQDKWFFIAFLAPIFWAIVNIIDVFFVSSVYKDEVDGTIVYGFFQLIPVAVLLFVLRNNLGNFSSHPILWLAILAGFLTATAFYFYFKALFHHSDVAFLQILWSLTIIAVPVFAFLLWRETLLPYKYLGMLITLVGGFLLALSEQIRSRFSKKYIWIMAGAVIFLSLSMVLQERVYSQLATGNLGGQSFLTGLLFFSIGGLLCGLSFALFGRRNPIVILRKYYKVFLALEIVNFLGILASQKAISIAPSVSYVATIETFVPVFVLIFSIITLFAFSSVLKKRSTEKLKDLYRQQLEGIWFKIAATIVMAVGVYIIS